MYQNFKRTQTETLREIAFIIKTIVLWRSLIGTLGFEHDYEIEYKNNFDFNRIRVL